MIVAAGLSHSPGPARSIHRCTSRNGHLALLLVLALLVSVTPRGAEALSPDDEDAVPAATSTDEATPAGEPTAPNTPQETPAALDAEAPGPAEGEDEEAASRHSRAPRSLRQPYADETASSEVTRWRRRVQALMLDLEVGRSEPAAVDRLYAEFSAEFWPLQAEVHQAVHDDAPDLVDRHTELIELYEVRSRLFGAITPDLYSNLTSLDPLGREELAHELDYLSANLEYQQHILETALDHLRENIAQAPSATLFGIVEILAAIIGFRLWRRWARTAIPGIRRSLLEARPRSRTNLRAARFLWYFERIRGPVEWLALIWLFTLLVHPAGFEEISTLVSTFAKWLLIGMLAVRVIDAMAARGAGGLRRDQSKLRLRSLRLVGFWSVFLGLGLDLAGRYAGTGVVYTWVVRGWLVLTLPVAFVLVHWWRGVIFERLKALNEPSTWAVALAGRSEGFASYPAATAGGLLLLWNGLVRLMVRGLSASEAGRRVIAVLVRREVARDIDRDHHADETPIADEIILPLIAARDVLIDEIAKGELDGLVASIGAHGGGGSIVIGERGAGKSIFLGRVADALDGAMGVVDCPAGGWESFERSLGESFDVEPGEGFGPRLGAVLEKRGIRAVGVDNAHRLARPERGGQAGLERLSTLDTELGYSVSWVLAIDRHAWRYILRAGAERAMLHQVIELPTWTEEQLAQLVERRAEAVGLEPDYGRLVLPRQLDTGDHDDADDRNRFGYARVLWELADGNPEVSLYLFAESLRRCADDSVILRLPQLRSAGSLTNAQPDALLVLRALIYCDVASVDDVAHNVRISEARVQAILSFCIRSGWVSEELDGYRVSWRWYRSVTRALVRQNLVGR